jgi:hypothetical protein
MAVIARGLNSRSSPTYIDPRRTIGRLGRALFIASLLLCALPRVGLAQDPPADSPPPTQQTDQPPADQPTAMDGPQCAAAYAQAYSDAMACLRAAHDEAITKVEDQLFNDLGDYPCIRIALKEIEDTPSPAGLSDWEPFESDLGWTMAGCTDVDLTSWVFHQAGIKLFVFYQLPDFKTEVDQCLAAFDQKQNNIDASCGGSWINQKLFCATRQVIADQCEQYAYNCKESGYAPALPLTCSPRVSVNPAMIKAITRINDPCAFVDDKAQECVGDCRGDKSCENDCEVVKQLSLERCLKDVASSSASQPSSTPGKLPAHSLSDDNVKSKSAVKKHSRAKKTTVRMGTAGTKHSSKETSVSKSRRIEHDADSISSSNRRHTKSISKASRSTQTKTLSLGVKQSDAPSSVRRNLNQKHSLAPKMVKQQDERSSASSNLNQQHLMAPNVMHTISPDQRPR